MVLRENNRALMIRITEEVVGEEGSHRLKHQRCQSTLAIRHDNEDDMIEK